MSKKVFIGVGHGGSDPGAVANGFEEADLNLAIALACQAELLRHGVIVQMSRTKDENDTLAQEIAECNAFNPDFAIDIHNNAGGGDGAEVYHGHTDKRDDALATNILDAIKAIGQNSRGLKTRRNANGTDYFGFVRSIKAPSIIVECAFVDNKKDIQIIDTAAEQKAMGVAIAKGVLKTLGIVYKEQTTSTKLYKVQIGAYSVRDNAVNMQKKLKAAGFDAIIV
jgi:N-acetylmuramoyl-L-alanine amidase